MTTKSIDEALNISNEIKEVRESSVVKFESGSVRPNEQDIIDDYNFARSTLRDLIEKGGEALNDAISLTKESPQPRTIEVTATLISQIASVSKDLLSLSKTAKEIESKVNSPGVGTPTEGPQNNLYITTEALSEMLNSVESEKDDEQ
jgi:hypothetical protein